MTIKKLLERNALGIAIILTVFITILSLVSLKGIHIIKVNNSDKFEHFFGYIILSLSWLYAFKDDLTKQSKKFLLIILLIIYGIIIEVLQGVLTTNRQADFYDVIANSIGVLTAVLLYSKIFVKV